MKCDELRIENACVYGPDAKVYLAEQVDTAIAELKQKLESVQASMYCDVVDANMENRRLRRALLLARADRAKTMAKLYSQEAELILLREHYPKGCGWCHIMNNKWKKVERLCIAKAEEYK